MFAAFLILIFFQGSEHYILDPGGNQTLRTVPDAVINNNYDYPYNCTNIWLRRVPVNLNVSENGHYYLESFIYSQLRLKFSNCTHQFRCVLYNPLTNTSKRLRFERDQIEFIIEDNSRGLIRCARAYSFRPELEFYLFVELPEQKSLTGISISNGPNESIFVKCPTTRYDKGVKLRVNGDPLDIPFDPFDGFFLNSSYETDKKFFQCERNDELVGSTYFRVQPLALQSKSQFLMIEQPFLFKTQMQCIITNVQFDEKDDVKVLLACPNRKTCPPLTLVGNNSSRRRVYKTTLDNKAIVSRNDYSCVFLRNNEVIAHTFLREAEHFTRALIILSIAAFAVVIVVCVLNFCGGSKYKKIAGDSPFEKFSAHDFLGDTESIGRGNSSIIRKMILSSNKQPVVIKYSFKNAHFVRELEMLRKLKHVNIIKVIGTADLSIEKSCYQVKVEHLVLPYYPEKALNDFLMKFYPVKQVIEDQYPTFLNAGGTDRLTTFEMVAIAFQVADGLKYLRGKKITHRDIAMRNILISEKRLVKIADFERAENGETRKVNFVQRLRATFGVLNNIPMYIYPIEALQGYYYYSSEVFSFGRLLHDIFQFGCQPPFSQESYLLTLRKEPDRTMHCPAIVYEVIRDCMKYDFKVRPSIDECLGRLDSILRTISTTCFAQLKMNRIEEDKLVEPVLEKSADEYPENGVIQRLFEV